MNEQSYLTDVLAFASKHNRVFPTRSKRPLVEWTKAATDDPGVIEAWWRQYGHPDYAWAVPEGFVVVDIDDRAAFDAAMLELPKTAMQETPRGEHWVYASNGHAVEQRTHVAPGTDLRVGGKGYINLYDPRRLLANKAECPSWVVGNVHERPAAAVPVPDVLGTRDDILRFLGTTAHAGKGFGVRVYRAMLFGLRAQGGIVALDPARPWTDDDLEELAEQAEAWDREAISGREMERKVEAALRKGVETPAVAPNIFEQTGFRMLDSIPLIEPPPLLLGRWAPDGASILYGTGGVGKGRLASQEIAFMTQVDENARILIVDYEDHEQEWRGRVAQCGGDLSRVFLVAPFSTGWKVKGKTILDHADLLYQLVQARSITYLVIDSAMMAVPGVDVGDPAAPQAWAVALQQIGLPSLTLGHVTKADADPAYPFGSVYWHNLARITWSMSVKDDQLVLRSRKSNNYKRPSSITLAEPEQASTFSVPGPFWRMTGFTESIADRILDLLRQYGPMSNADLAHSLAENGEPVKDNSIAAALGRLKGKRIAKDGDQWRIQTVTDLARRLDDRESET